MATAEVLVFLTVPSDTGGNVGGKTRLDTTPVRAS